MATIAAIYLLAVAAPLIAGIVLSFSPLDALGAHHWSLAGYKAVIAGGYVRELAQLASRALMVTILACLIGVPAAFWIRQRRNPGAALILLTALIAPWLVSDMLRAFGWQLLLSPDGPMSGAWQALGGGPLEGLRYNRVAVVVGLLSATLPACVVSVFAALPSADSTEWMAARELGAPRHVLALMSVGRARAGLIFGGCAVFLFSFFGSAEPRFLDGPTQTSVQTIASSLADIGVSALLAWGGLLLMVTLLICAGFALVFMELRRPGRTPVSHVIPAIKRRGSFWAGVMRAKTLDFLARVLPPLSAATAILLCSAPVAMVLAEAFREPRPGGAVWSVSSFSLMMASPDLIDALLRSVGLGLVVAGVASASGFLLSLSIWDAAAFRAVLGILVALVILPAEVYAISAIQVSKALGFLEGSLALVLVAHLVWTAPFAVTGLILANRSITMSVLESALEYGRTPISVALKTIAPINRGAILGASLFVFSLSLNESTRTTYLGGALPSLGNQVYGRLQAGLLPENRGIFAVEALLIGLAVAAALVALTALQKGFAASKIQS